MSGQYNHGSGGLRMKKTRDFTKPSSAWDGADRNRRCYCGSGKKFKNCCLNPQPKWGKGFTSVSNAVDRVIHGR